MITWIGSYPRDMRRAVLRLTAAHLLEAGIELETVARALERGGVHAQGQAGTVLGVAIERRWAPKGATIAAWIDPVRWAFCLLLQHPGFPEQHPSGGPIFIDGFVDLGEMGFLMHEAPR